MNADCRKIQVLINDYLDGTLSPSAAEALQSHLSECAECNEGLEQEKQIISLVQTLPVQHVSSAVLRRIEARTVKQKRRTDPGIWIREKLLIPAWPKVAFGVAVVAIAAMMIWQPFSDPADHQNLSYTELDARSAKSQAKWSLAYISDLIRKTEKHVVTDILLKDMPGTLKKSLEKSLPILKGD